jgi:hypothetical protein
MLDTTRARKHSKKTTYSIVGINALIIRINVFFSADISADVDERDGVKISRFLFYVEEMKKNKNFGFEKEFKVITFWDFLMNN